MLRKVIFAFLLFAYVSLAANITTFAAPDNSYDALAKFINENDNFLIAVYEFENYDIAKLLIDKNFTLIVDESPAGGLSEGEKFILCTLNKGNIYLYQSRYYMHAKYAVSGNKVLIATENFGYHGFPQGYGNRGYGVIAEDDKIVNDFISVFNEDLNKSKSFVCDKGYTLSEKEKKIYQKEFGVQNFDGTVRSLFAPDAVDDIVDFVNTSKERLYIAQLYIHKEWGTKREPKPNVLLEAAIDRARNGVEVKILLDSSWFNVDEEGKSNEDTVQYINEIARKENLNLEAKLIDLDKLNIDELHGKLIISDNYVLISSINWGENSPTNNREAGVVIYGDAANYFSKIFLADWDHEDAITGKVTEDRTPVIIAIVIVAVIIILVILFMKYRRK